MVHTHTHTHTVALMQTHRHTSLKQSFGFTKVTHVLVKGSLMSLVLGNLRAFGDLLAKTSIILSSVPLNRLFYSCPQFLVVF